MALLWIRDAAAKYLKGWVGERWAVSWQWSIRGQARYALAQDDSMG